jgi:hypothetical protein
VPQQQTIRNSGLKQAPEQILAQVQSADVPAENILLLSRYSAVVRNYGS